MGKSGFTLRIMHVKEHNDETIQVFSSEPNSHSAQEILGRQLPSEKRLRGQVVNLLKPTSYVIHQQFNIQQLYALSTLYSCFVLI